VQLQNEIRERIAVAMDARTKAAVLFVAGNGWLGACKPDFREWMLGHLRWQSYVAGSGISYAGDDRGALYCVGEGQVNFVAGTGAADIGTSYVSQPGSWWGHAPLLGAPRLGSAIAVADAVCGAMPITLLRARLRSHPEDWRSIALGLSELFMHSAGAHADLLIPDSARRVAATILRLGGYRHLTFPVMAPASFVCTQEHLAGATALSRNTVGKLLRGFEKDLLLDARYGRIAILDVERLRGLVLQSP
jgi:CRP/FNR family transcriptional regulator, cyclic AMP receptor protein